MTLSHPSRYLGQGLIASNDSVSTAMAKASVIPPWPGMAHVLGERCALRSTEVLMATLQDAGPKAGRPRATLQECRNPPKQGRRRGAQLSTRGENLCP